MKRKSHFDVGVDLVINIFLVLIGIICIYPIWFVIVASISDPNAIGRGEVVFWPIGLNTSGYEMLLEFPDLWRGYFNSLCYLFAGSFFSLAITLPAAFALSNGRLVGRKPINTFFIICMYFGGGMIPTYILHTSIDYFVPWMDTPWVMIIPPAMNVYNMIIARTSFESLPPALQEAAEVDGCNHFRFFFQFALPLCKATIAVLFLFTALSWWNEYMRFVIYIESPELQSLQVIVRQITEALTESLDETASGAEIAENLRRQQLLRYSVVVVVALPFVMLYPFVQKYFNKGVMIGSVKG